MAFRGQAAIAVMLVAAALLVGCDDGISADYAERVIMGTHRDASDVHCEETGDTGTFHCEATVNGERQTYEVQDHDRGGVGISETIRRP